YKTPEKNEITFYSLYMHLRTYKDLPDEKHLPDDEKEYPSIFYKWKLLNSCKEPIKVLKIRSKGKKTLVEIPKGNKFDLLTFKHPKYKHDAPVYKNKAGNPLILSCVRYNGIIGHSYIKKGATTEVESYYEDIQGQSYKVRVFQLINPAQTSKLKQGFSTIKNSTNPFTVTGFIPYKDGKTQINFKNPLAVCDLNGNIKPGLHQLTPPLTGSINVASPSELKADVYIKSPVLDKTKNCAIKIKGGELIGWSGGYGIDARPSGDSGPGSSKPDPGIFMEGKGEKDKLRAIHLEVFCKDKNIDFMENPKGEGKKNIYIIKPETKVHDRISPPKVQSGKSIPKDSVVKIVEQASAKEGLAGNSCKVKVVGRPVEGLIQWATIAGKKFTGLKTPKITHKSGPEWIVGKDAILTILKPDLKGGVYNVNIPTGTVISQMDNKKTSDKAYIKIVADEIIDEGPGLWIADKNQLKKESPTQYLVTEKIKEIYNKDPESFEFSKVPKKSGMINNYHIEKKDCQLITDVNDTQWVKVTFPADPKMGKIWYYSEDERSTGAGVWIKKEDLKTASLFDWPGFYNNEQLFETDNIFVTGLNSSLEFIKNNKDFSRDSLMEIKYLCKKVDKDDNEVLNKEELHKLISAPTVDYKFRSVVCRHPPEWTHPGSVGEEKTKWKK
ncbi:MAG: hypothetical protein GY786_09780, partial [Proteobacteria bacterium]|nr:hypothetical protein [Pseudomonadota bacterium]